MTSQILITNEEFEVIKTNYVHIHTQNDSDCFAWHKPEVMAKTGSMVFKPEVMAKTGSMVSKPEVMAKTGSMVSKPEVWCKPEVMVKTGSMVSKPEV